MPGSGYFSKIILNGTTLMDVTQDTVAADKLMTNYTATKNDGSKITGTYTGAVAVTEEQDAAGGTIKHITALNISDTTATASDVASGKYFYTAAGVKTAGTASGGGGSETESGQVTLSASQNGLNVSFTNTHTAAPSFFLVARETDGQSFSQYTTGTLVISGGSFTRALGVSTIESNASASFHYDAVVFRMVKSSSITNTAIACSTDGATQWSTYVSSTGLNLPTADQYPAGTYKWIASWDAIT